MDGAVNADFVERIIHKQNPSGVWSDWAVMRDGGHVPLLYGEPLLDEVIPNYNLNLELWRVYFEKDSGGDDLWFEILPITAWKVIDNGSTEPLTVSCGCDELNTLIHDRSRGTWITLFGEYYATAEAMLNELYRQASYKHSKAA